MKSLIVVPVLAAKAATRECKFDFKIDGVSHVNWFRKKMNEFREAIGIPKPRQNRSMKL